MSDGAIVTNTLTMHKAYKTGERSHFCPDDVLTADADDSPGKRKNMIFSIKFHEIAKFFTFQERKKILKESYC